MYIHVYGLSASKSIHHELREHALSRCHLNRQLCQSEEGYCGDYSRYSQSYLQ